MTRSPVANDATKRKRQNVPFIWASTTATLPSIHYTKILAVTYVSQIYLGNLSLQETWTDVSNFGILSWKF